ncbi:MAG: serine/threonine-protein kinase [Sandaracinaceae bacterium]
MFEVGEKIDDVEIVARLRAGGMAALYLGRRQGAGGFSKDIAIKVIHTHLASDQSFVEMFVDEARLSARIDHPNVVRVESLRQHKGAYCLLMEFVHGTSLSQMMGTLKKRDMRFSPELAVAITTRVADGLHAAHELLNPDGTAAGVVHRDVSPANVLVGYRGDVKLIDFGIAKATQRLHQTEAAGLKGKIAYMSPEQAFGRDVDRRTDVYALGIVLWEMLTMRRLFKADNDLRLLDMVRDPKVVPPSALVPDLPPALDRVILETLAGDRERRPTTARDFRYRLLDALPSAAAIDPLQISAVICDVMSEKIAEDREILSISSFNSLPTTSEKESVTVSRLLRPVGSEVNIDLDQLGSSAQDLAAGMDFVPTGERPAPPALLPQTSEVMMTPTGVPQGKKRKILPLVLGVAAGLGLAAGGVVGLTYALFSGEESRAQAEEPSATLPETAAETTTPALPPTPETIGTAPDPDPVVEAPEVEAEPPEEQLADAEEIADEEPEESAAASRRARRDRAARRANRRGRALATSAGGGSDTPTAGGGSTQSPSQGGSSQGSSGGTPSRGSSGRSGPTKIIRSANF